MLALGNLSSLPGVLLAGQVMGKGGEAERLQVVHFGSPGEAMSVPCSPVSLALWDLCHQPSNRAVLPQGTAALRRSCPAQLHRSV